MEEKLKAFAGKYIANRQLCWEMDQQVMEDLSFSKWKEALISRSQVTRKIYLENERFLKDMRTILHNPLTPELAETVYEILRSFYEGGYDDLFIIRALIELIQPYYEEKKDYSKMLYMRKVLAYEHYEFYWRLSREEGCGKAVELYEHALELKSHYSEIKDVEDRLSIFKCYRNLAAIIANSKNNSLYRSRMFLRLNEALTFWNSDEVQKLDGDNPDFIHMVDKMESDIIFFLDLTLDSNPEFVSEYKGLVDRITKKHRQDNIEDSDGILYRASLRCSFFDGKPAEKIIDELIEHIDSLGTLDYTDEESTLEKLLDYHNTGCTILEMLRFSDFSEEKCNEVLPRFVDKITDIHSHVPFGFYTGSIDDFCAEWFEEVAPFDNDPVHKMEVLRKLVISRQPITYIHSLMVGEIATRITISLIKKHPEFFIGILGCKTAEDVRNRQEELCEYASKCALIHDCGKCEIVEVVNRQHRHLYTEEYDVIRMHPEKGYDMLKHDPRFDLFFDVIRGHHKSYDGKTGYPESFNNLLSPVKPLIDLITISDCIDAATDILGRNYVKGKTLSLMINELKAGSGTLYNPIIVGLIGSDTTLYEDLEYLTSEGRYEVYYRAYREIMLR